MSWHPQKNDCAETSIFLDKTHSASLTRRKATNSEQVNQKSMLYIVMYIRCVHLRHNPPRRVDDCLAQILGQILGNKAQRALSAFPHLSSLEIYHYRSRSFDRLYSIASTLSRANKSRMRAMYANSECNVCERQVGRQRVRFMPTTGAMYASNRNHDSDSEVDGDKRQPLLTTRQR